jgi:penicillin-insensitive murein endopeptidase
MDAHVPVQSVWPARLGVLAALACLAGCPQYGLLDDGTSISYGPSNRGKLMSPVRLPRSGEGYVIPPRWAARGLNWGTEEMVALITHTGRRLSTERPDAMLGVADLSPARGGPSAWHRSHQTGRDADLLFFVKDEQGKPVHLDRMVHFDADGTAHLPGEHGDKTVHFDVAQNWLLVRALMENPVAEVQYIFVFEPLRQLLLDHARTLGEPDELILQAGFVLHQPGDSAPHDDHFHVRIYCSLADRMAGCHDRGALRWTKKDYKYGPRRIQTMTPIAQNTAITAPMPAMIVLGAFPFLP